MTSETVACPYCGGQITAGFVKCRHCGEWLNNAAVQAAGHVPQGAIDVQAQAVTQGIEQHEAQSVGSSFFMALIVVGAVVLGATTHWLAGVAFFLVLFFVSALWPSKR